jgi:ABC-type amino acid transport system permease subunit
MNPSLQVLTRALVLITVLILLSYNLVAAINKSKNDSVGDVIISIIRDKPLLVFLAGFTYGHLMWY